MKDTKKPLRIGIFNALDGQISYNATAVPIYDEKVRSGESPRLYIVLSNQQEADADSNDNAWITDSSIEIEIVHKTGSEVSKDPIDDVYDDILEIILPTRTPPGITATGFRIVNGRREQSTTQAFEIGPTESIIVTRFRLTFLMTQT